MKNVNLGIKLIGGFALVALITLIVGVLGWRGVTTLDSEIVEIGKVRLPSIESLLIISNAAESTRVAQRTLLNPKLSDEDRARQYVNIDSARQAAIAAWDYLCAAASNRGRSRVVETICARLDGLEERQR